MPENKKKRRIVRSEAKIKKLLENTTNNPKKKSKNQKIKILQFLKSTKEKY